MTGCAETTTEVCGEKLQLVMLLNSFNRQLLPEVSRRSGHNMTRLVPPQPPRLSHLLALKDGDKGDSAGSRSGDQLEGSESPPTPSSSSSPSSWGGAADAADETLAAFWEDLKKDLKKDMRPDEAQLLESIKYEELVQDDNGLFRRMAEQQLGPIMAQLGLENEDPLEFFLELIKIATFMQFVTCGMAFYSSEVFGHLNTGVNNCRPRIVRWALDYVARCMHDTGIG